MGLFPSRRSFPGIAKEATKGIVQAPTSYIPLDGHLAWKEVPTILDDEGSRGAMSTTHGSQQGKKHTEWSAKGNVHVDTFGHILLSMFGEEALSGAGPYTHLFTVLNSGDGQPPGHTWTDFYVVETRQTPGCQTGKLEFDFTPDGLLKWSAEGLGLVTADGSEPTDTWGAIKPMQGWRAAATLNGVNLRYTSGKLTIERGIEAVKTAENSQAPAGIWVDGLTASAEFTALMESNAELTAWLADTQGVFEITFDRTPGAASTQEQLKLRASLAAYTAHEVDRSASWVQQKIGIKCHANTTDAGASGGFAAIRATLLNARSTVF